MHLPPFLSILSQIIKKIEGGLFGEIFLESHIAEKLKGGTL